MCVCVCVCVCVWRERERELSVALLWIEKRQREKCSPMFDYGLNFHRASNHYSVVGTRFLFAVVVLQNRLDVSTSCMVGTLVDFV